MSRFVLEPIGRNYRICCVTPKMCKQNDYCVWDYNPSISEEKELKEKMEQIDYVLTYGE